MDEIVEIFGKRLKIVQDESDDARICEKCAVEDICYNVNGNHSLPFCRDTKGKAIRHFEEVTD